MANPASITWATDAFRRDLQAYVRAVNVETERVVKVVALQVLQDVKRRTPVDTGFARNSWQMQRTGRLSWRIFSNAAYIVALEYGHSRTQAPRGMLRITLYDTARKLRDARASI